MSRLLTEIRVVLSEEYYALVGQFSLDASDDATTASTDSVPSPSASSDDDDSAPEVRTHYGAYLGQGVVPLSRPLLRNNPSSSQFADLK